MATKTTRWVARGFTIHGILVFLIFLWPFPKEWPESYQLTNQGVQALEEGRYGEAEALLRRAWRIRRTNALAVYVLGGNYGALADKKMRDSVKPQEPITGDEAIERQRESTKYAFVKVGCMVLSIPLFLGEMCRGMGNMATMPPTFIAGPWCVLVLALAMSKDTPERRRRWKRWFVFWFLSIVISAFLAMYLGNKLYMLLRVLR